MEHNRIVVFESKKIRRIWHDEEWYFSVVDVVEALTDSPTPRQYWGKLKNREFIDLQLSPIWVQLKFRRKRTWNPLIKEKRLLTEAEKYPGPHAKKPKRNWGEAL